MSVSVVIASANHAPFLAEAMESVLAQTYRDVELVVVDSGSTDRSADVAQSVVDAHPEARIELIRQPASGHPAHARNRGVQVARGDYLLCLDPYDKLAPDFVERCAGALDSDPEAGFAYTDQLHFGASNGHHDVPEYDFDALIRHNYLGLVALFRRSAWEAAGGFDPAIPYDDWDFWIGCGEQGLHGIKVDGTTWHHRVRTNGRLRGDSLPEVRRTRAELVRKRPELYSAGQHAWAEVVLAREPEPAGAVRSFATVAFADELVESPDLLRAYASAFGPADDATLVIYAPEEQRAPLTANGLVPLFAGMGLDGPDGPDIRTLPTHERSDAVADGARALLSREYPSSEFATLPRFDADTIAVLRAEAERSWRGNGESRAADIHTRFVSPGELVLHIGAGSGELTARYVQAGARVIAVEPNAERAQSLRERFAESDRICVLDKAVGSWEGAHESAWPQATLVQMTTLARLIETHGAPVLCKVDAEHFADHVLAGLDRPLPCVGFRFTAETLREARLCIWRLAALGMTEFNYSLDGSEAWAAGAWAGARELYAALDALELTDFAWADAYARPRG